MEAEALQAQNAIKQVEADKNIVTIDQDQAESKSVMDDSFGIKFTRELTADEKIIAEIILETQGKAIKEQVKNNKNSSA